MKAAVFHQCEVASKNQIEEVPEPQLNTRREANTNISLPFWNEKTLIGSALRNLNDKAFQHLGAVWRHA